MKDFEYKDKIKTAALGKQTDEVGEIVASAPKLIDLYSTECPDLGTNEEHLNNYRVHKAREAESGVQLWDVDGGYSITVDGKFIVGGSDNIENIRLYDRIIAWKKQS